jgi:hypothetical protein
MQDSRKRALVVESSSTTILDIKIVGKENIPFCLS